MWRANDACHRVLLGAGPPKVQSMQGPEKKRTRRTFLACEACEAKGRAVPGAPGRPRPPGLGSPVTKLSQHSARLRLSSTCNVEAPAGWSLPTPRISLMHLTEEARFDQARQLNLFISSSKKPLMHRHPYQPLKHQRAPYCPNPAQSTSCTSLFLSTTPFRKSFPSILTPAASERRKWKRPGSRAATERSLGASIASRW